MRHKGHVSLKLDTFKYVEQIKLSKKKYGNYHIVLDLDGILIDSSDDDVIYLRPRLKIFLESLFNNFKYINIWTASDKSWCKKVVDHIREHSNYQHL